eukprot:scaffold188673_cov18-Tisochrysis_lutea.AAC.1
MLLQAQAQHSEHMHCAASPKPFKSSDRLDLRCCLVKADFLPLSKSKHGRHLVQKLISQAKKEEVPSKCWDLGAQLNSYRTSP